MSFVNVLYLGSLSMSGSGAGVGIYEYVIFTGQSTCKYVLCKWCFNNVF